MTNMTSKLTSSSVWSVYSRLLVTCLLLGLGSTTAADAFEYQHGTSYLEPLKYKSGFTHFEWANPDAPKGGLLRAPEMGTFDSFNGILDKGRIANGVARGGEGALIYDRLLEGAIDEPASFYGRLADGVWVAADFRRFAFRIREGAYWHDGKPLGADDVVYTFRLLKEKGAVAVRTGLRELGSIEKISDNEVLFTTKPDAIGNPDLIFQVGGYSILPEHYWASRDITKTTVEPPLGSGPYKVRDFDLGRNVTYERGESYWGRDTPVNRGC